MEMWRAVGAAPLDRSAHLQHICAPALSHSALMWAHTLVGRHGAPELMPLLRETGVVFMFSLYPTH